MMTMRTGTAHAANVLSAAVQPRQHEADPMWKVFTLRVIDHIGPVSGFSAGHIGSRGEPEDLSVIFDISSLVILVRIYYCHEPCIN